MQCRIASRMLHRPIRQRIPISASPHLAIAGLRGSPRENEWHIICTANDRLPEYIVAVVDMVHGIVERFSADQVEYGLTKVHLEEHCY